MQTDVSISLHQTSLLSFENGPRHFVPAECFLIDKSSVSK